MIHVFRIEKPTGIFTPPGSSFASCVGSIEKISSFIHAAINEIPEKHRRKTERNFAKQAVHLLPAWDLLEEHRARSKKSLVPNSAWWLSLE